jgi:hypothetical protein
MQKRYALHLNQGPDCLRHAGPPRLLPKGQGPEPLQLREETPKEGYGAGKSSTPFTLRPPRGREPREALQQCALCIPGHSAASGEKGLDPSGDAEDGRKSSAVTAPLVASLIFTRRSGRGILLPPT